MAERERPLHELLSRDMVDIYVGEENTHWILHEKLLCYRSKFFYNIFHNKKGTKNTRYGLPDEEDEPFRLFVAWLYSATLPMPKEEKDLVPLFDLYLMSEKWEIKRLTIEVLEAVRRWYHDSDTWPGLRRVQYIYANTEGDSPMRRLVVSCVARMLVLGDSMPAHWENALRKNGQLAVDIIMTVQKWHIEPENVSDPRDRDMEEIVEEVEVNREIKQEAAGEDSANEESGYMSGVKSEEEEGQESEGQEQEQES